MAPTQPTPRGTPHLTPARLIGRRFASSIFAGITVALVGYCPRPPALDRYQPRDTADQYFIHVPPASVQTCAYAGIPFLSIVHVYGGPVSAALLEELAYYGVTDVLAYGLAGGLGVAGQQLGDWYLVEQALVADGTTPHYTAEPVVASDPTLNALITAQARAAGLPTLHPVQAFTDDAIYREYDDELAAARARGCAIVNCDSAHLFAVSRTVGIRSTECGVLTDVARPDGGEWDSSLAAMLTTSNSGMPDLLTQVGLIVALYVEAVLPALVRA
jgi:uridine phosphorylase